MMHACKAEFQDAHLQAASDSCMHGHSKLDTDVPVASFSPRPPLLCPPQGTMFTVSLPAAQVRVIAREELLFTMLYPPIAMTAAQ